MSVDHYKSLEDFVADSYFIKWIKAPDSESNAFWEEWILRYPDRIHVLQQAKEVILLMDFMEVTPPEGKFLEIWDNISKATGSTVNLAVSIQSKQINNNGKNRRLNWFYKAAAALVLCSLSLWGYSVYNNLKTITISTSYGESRILFLPDSTKVTLNANSKLRFRRIDFTSSHREVWLDGQAFFAVTHKSNNENFKVHTNELQVEVLGTRFDVNSRRGKTKVILEEGKVKLDIDRKDRVKQSLVMKPGDLVEVATNSLKINRQVVELNDYLAWRSSRIEFSGSTLDEVGQWIEDNYGFKVVFVQEDLRNRKFTGSTSRDDMQELFQKLSKVFNLDIKQEGKMILINGK